MPQTPSEGDSRKQYCVTVPSYAGSFVMQHSERPLLELARARDAIQAMRNAKTLDEFEDHWKAFLGRLQRVWNKAASHFRQSPKWDGWKGQFQHLRDTDPLLLYLVHARNADEHTVQEILGKEPPGIGIGPAEGNWLRIERMVVKDGNFFVKSLHPVKIVFFPERTKLLPVTNRGITYPVPTTHLDKPVDPMNVIAVAEAGAQFYEHFLFEAEKFFVG